MEQSTLDILPEEMSIASDISVIESDTNSWTIITSGSIRRIHFRMPSRIFIYN